MRSTLSMALALVLGASAAEATARFDGNYIGRSTVLGGTIPDCKGGQAMRGSVQNGKIALMSKARDGTTRPGVGKVSPSGTFVAIKRLDSGGIITYAGSFGRRGIVGKWKGPTCHGVFELVP